MVNRWYDIFDRGKFVPKLSCYLGMHRWYPLGMNMVAGVAVVSLECLDCGCGPSEWLLSPMTPDDMRHKGTTEAGS